MLRRCKVCWLHPRLRLWVENQLLTPDISLRKSSRILHQHGIPISHVSLQRHKTENHIAPAHLNPVQKIDWYTTQLQPQKARLRKRQLLTTWIQQWHQLQRWHQTQGDQEAAEADQQQIQQLQNQLQHKTKIPNQKNREAP